MVKKSDTDLPFAVAVTFRITVLFEAVSPSAIAGTATDNEAFVEAVIAAWKSSLFLMSVGPLTKVHAHVADGAPATAASE